MFNKTRFIKFHDLLSELGFKPLNEVVHCNRNPMSYVPEDKEYKITFIGKDGGVLTVDKTAKIKGAKYIKRTIYFSDFMAARSLAGLV